MAAPLHKPISFPLVIPSVHSQSQEGRSPLGPPDTPTLERHGYTSSTGRTDLQVVLGIMASSVSKKTQKTKMDTLLFRFMTKKKQKGFQYETRRQFILQATCCSKEQKKSFFCPVLKCFHSERKEKKLLWIGYCMFMEAAVTSSGFVVRRAGPCTLKGYIVIRFSRSSLLSFFLKQCPAFFFFFKMFFSAAVWLVFLFSLCGYSRLVTTLRFFRESSNLLAFE